MSAYGDSKRQKVVHQGYSPIPVANVVEGFKHDTDELKLLLSGLCANYVKLDSLPVSLSSGFMGNLIQTNLRPLGHNG